MLYRVRCSDPGTIETPSKPVGRMSASGIGARSASYSAATLSARPTGRVASGPQKPWVRLRLGVVVDQQDPAPRPGQRAGEVVAGRGLADPAFLVQERDRGLPCWSLLWAGRSTVGSGPDLIGLGAGRVENFKKNTGKTP